MILNWADYIDDSLVQEFERDTGIKVKMSYYETDDTRDSLLLETGGKGYDIVIVNGLKIAPYQRQGWLAPINAKQLPNLKFVSPTWRNAYPQASHFAVPYLWGTLGLAYRQDLVSNRVINSWSALFNPGLPLQGKVMWVKAVRDLIGPALKSLGYSANTTNQKHLNEVGVLLQQNRRFVHSLGYTLIDEMAKLVTGEVILAPVYNGDALSLQAVEPNVRYVIPK
ncbi:MAG: spermidine/putrescine ABC transporter substrate-binding protein [Methylococcales bacterium]|nr:spermidine/putrescine ABC transporter substrate-binding protein [Methylococcales bacterium]